MTTETSTDPVAAVRLAVEQACTCAIKRAPKSMLALVETLAQRGQDALAAGANPLHFRERYVADWMASSWARHWPGINAALAALDAACADLRPGYWPAVLPPTSEALRAAVDWGKRCGVAGMPAYLDEVNWWTDGTAILCPSTAPARRRMSRAIAPQPAGPRLALLQQSTEALRAWLSQLRAADPLVRPVRLLLGREWSDDPVLVLAKSDGAKATSYAARNVAIMRFCGAVRFGLVDSSELPAKEGHRARGTILAGFAADGSCIGFAMEVSSDWTGTLQRWLAAGAADIDARGEP